MEVRATESRGDEAMNVYELLVIRQPSVSRVGNRILVPLTHREKMDCQLDTAIARNAMSHSNYQKIGNPLWNAARWC